MQQRHSTLEKVVVLFHGQVKNFVTPFPKHFPIINILNFNKN